MLLWRGSLLPLGYEVAPKPFTRVCQVGRIQHSVSLGLLRNPAGASSLATKVFAEVSGYSSLTLTQRSSRAAMRIAAASRSTSQASSKSVPLPPSPARAMISSCTSSVFNSL
ncbi:hypothetical protein SAMN03159473_01648 [Pseudomonas sp. NFACC52]|nr:hypothetical protein SAMN03159481_02657 [Pseudomonas sp. NFACC56-3]SFK37603.1 hypothetical protein SAMN03159473_01648 [Pseudomonas sp. NFACC52]